MAPMRGVSPQRQLASLSYIEVVRSVCAEINAPPPLIFQAPMKAERRVPPPSAAEDDDRLKPVQVSPRLAGGAKARTSARMKVRSKLLCRTNSRG